MSLFVIAEMKSVVRILQENFHLTLREAVTQELNKMLGNKVWLYVGICANLKELKSLTKFHTLLNDGSLTMEAKFDYYIFRPRIGSVLTAIIDHCSPEGVYVRLGQYNNIFIPPSELKYPSRFDEAAQAWVWELPVNGNEKEYLLMKAGDAIKLIVKREVFEEKIVMEAPLENNNAQQQQGRKKKAQKIKKTMYQIIGAITEPELGVLHWSTPQNQEEEYEHGAEYKTDDVDEE